MLWFYKFCVSVIDQYLQKKYGKKLNTVERLFYKTINIKNVPTKLAVILQRKIFYLLYAPANGMQNSNFLKFQDYFRDP